VSEWKPGDVATIRGPGLGPAVAMRGAAGAWVWVDANGSNPNGGGNACYCHGSSVTDARPLVVIDPEDREQIERLLSAYYNGEGNLGDLVDKFQAALRSLVAPPKPVEPTGRYAVVVDTGGAEWLRREPGDMWLEQRNQTSVSLDAPAFRARHWGLVDAVRVLSEGIQP
jgi:hypothetical protein